MRTGQAGRCEHEMNKTSLSMPKIKRRYLVWTSQNEISSAEIFQCNCITISRVYARVLQSVKLWGYCGPTFYPQTQTVNLTGWSMQVAGNVVWSPMLQPTDTNIQDYDHCDQEQIRCSFDTNPSRGFQLRIKSFTLYPVGYERVEGKLVL
jgi:hypothetical protein